MDIIRFVKKSFLLFGFFILIFSDAVSQERITEVINITSDSPLQMSDLRVNSEKTGLYEKFEITFDLKGQWDNPFDPDQIKVDAHFVSPSGKKIEIPGFFYQDYWQGLNNRPEMIGTPVWKIRFAPAEMGEYKYEVIAVNKGKEVRSSSKSFISLSYNSNHGFLRISRSNPYYFEFDDGSSFFAVSMDNAVNNVGNYRKIYARFSESGGNYNRLFVQYANLDIGELKASSSGSDKGLGKIHLDNSWNLDKVIELGEQMGIYHQLCLTNQYNFNAAWGRNVFNKANGGILNSPREYYTNEESMRYLEKRFRYIVARWGYSTSVFSWNLWNEYSAQPGFSVSSAVAWHQRMAHYISSLDAFHHVIHTNDGRLNGINEINSLPEIELVSTNSYGIKNIAEVSGIWTRRMTSQFKKPYILAEFGIGHDNLPRGGYAGVDPARIMIHDALWSPLMNGSAGTGMAWEGNWIDDPLFYTYINAVSKIVKDIPFGKLKWFPVTVSSFKFKNKQAPYYADVIVEGWNPTGNYGMPTEAQNHKVFQIDMNGKLEANEFLTAVLSDTTGKGKSRNIPSVTFKAEFPANGEFVVFVSDVRNANPAVKLSVSIDGKQSIKKDILPVPFIQYFTISISKGSHTITIENSGGGNFTTSFELKNFIMKNGPDLEVRGLQSEDYILLWLKNQKFTLLHEMTNIGLLQQPEGILELKNVPDGTWVAEWINTINAVEIKSELIKSIRQTIVLQIPSTDKSIAVRLHRITDKRASLKTHC